MKSLGRRAGLLFFLHGLPAPFALLYVARRIFVPGDMAATADRVREHAMLLRRPPLAVAHDRCVIRGRMLSRAAPRRSFSISSS